MTISETCCLCSTTTTQTRPLRDPLSLLHDGSCRRRVDIFLVYLLLRMVTYGGLILWRTELVCLPHSCCMFVMFSCYYAVGSKYNCMVLAYYIYFLEPLAAS